MEFKSAKRYANGVVQLDDDTEARFFLSQYGVLDQLNPAQVPPGMVPNPKSNRRMVVFTDDGDAFMALGVHCFNCNSPGYTVLIFPRCVFTTQEAIQWIGKIVGVDYVSGLQAAVLERNEPAAN